MKHNLSLKKSISFALLFAAGTAAYAQKMHPLSGNTFPSTGNVSIGTATPATLLQVLDGTTRMGSAANYASFDATGN